MATEYEPLTGQVTGIQRDSAIREYERRVGNGEHDVEVLVAQRVPLEQWRRSNIGSIPFVYFEARYTEADPSLVDVFITKVQGIAHTQAAAEVTGQIFVYTRNTGSILAVGGGTMELEIPGGLPGGHFRVMIRPETALRPRYSTAGDSPIQPRLIVEVEFPQRSLPAAQSHCRRFFDMLPELRAVLLVKFFRRQEDRTFACVAIVYLREAPGQSVVTGDAVSVGSAPLDL